MYGDAGWRRARLRRAVTCALAALEQRGVDLSEVTLHGQRLFGRDQQDERCFIDLGWNGFGSMGRLLHSGVTWLEVLRPHRTEPLDALLSSRRLARNRKRP